MLFVLLLCLLWTGVIGYWLLTPRPDQAEAAAAMAEARLRALQDRKKATYDNLRDLHFEHLAGKLSDADYQRTRTMLETEAAGLTGQIEAAQAGLAAQTVQAH